MSGGSQPSQTAPDRQAAAAARVHLAQPCPAPLRRYRGIDAEPPQHRREAQPVRRVAGKFREQLAAAHGEAAQHIVDAGVAGLGEGPTNRPGRNAGEAADVLALLVLRQWLASAALAAPPLLVLCDRAGILLWTVAVARLVQLALVLPLLPAIGLLAASVAGLAGGLVETVWLLATLLRLLGRG